LRGRTPASYDALTNEILGLVGNLSMSTAQTRIGPADHGRRMTIDEFRDAEEEPGYLYELARGVVEATEIRNDPHGQIEDNLRSALEVYRLQHPGLIRRCGGASAFRLWVPEMISGRNPDLAFVLEGTPKDERGRRRPAWAAEVVSAGKRARDRDYIAKREEYLLVADHRRTDGNASHSGMDQT